MPKAAKILVMRFSAMGDVAMVVPVLREFTENHPEAEILVVSRAFFKPFFKGISNTTFHSFDPKHQHKGFWGLLKLFFELKAQQVTAVADLHNNLRSKVLTFLFFLFGIESATVDKGRKEKKQLTRRKGKMLIPLQLTVQRYAEVFGKIGFPFRLKNQLNNDGPKKTRTEKWIGVSPFAQHLQKVYPLHKMEKVVTELAKKGHQIFVFGGTSEEQAIAESWAIQHEGINSVVRKMKLHEEIQLISKLDVMLSMDSSGMHLASLENIPVVSIWGATHPYAGFMGYGQSIANAVQMDLYCRPCSVYGNTPCYRGDFACMNNLSEQSVIDAVLNKLKDEQTTVFS